MALSLPGFNLGIEAMQLAVTALTLPWLILLARTPAYPAVRVGGGGAWAWTTHSRRWPIGWAYTGHGLSPG